MHALEYAEEHAKRGRTNLAVLDLLHFLKGQISMAVTLEQLTADVAKLTNEIQNGVIPALQKLQLQNADQAAQILALQQGQDLTAPDNAINTAEAALEAAIPPVAATTTAAPATTAPPTTTSTPVTAPPVV